jgi:hypothetical protein
MPSSERSAISANPYWVADTESASPDHHPPAAAKENGQQMTAEMQKIATKKAIELSVI